VSAPTSPVEICNLALDFLGQPSIADIEAPSTAAEGICARHYDQVRRQLLREWVWNFAKKRVTIFRSGTPAFDFADQYALPNDFVRFLSAGGDREIDQGLDYDIEGRNLLTNSGGAASIGLRYIYDVKDPQQMDAAFINLLALALALKIGYKFTLKKGLVEQLSAQYAADLPKGISIDGQERPPRRIQRSKYHRARLIGSTGNVADAYTVLD